MSYLPCTLQVTELRPKDLESRMHTDSISGDQIGNIQVGHLRIHDGVSEPAEG